MNNDPAMQWWYALGWRERCRFRDLCRVEIMTPELMDKLYSIYGKENKIIR